MHLFANKKRLFLIYGFFVLLSAGVFLINRYLDLSPWSLTLTFLLLLFLPGFSLARIFRIKFEEDDAGNLVLWLTLGLMFILLLAFLVLLIGLTITILTVIYLIVMALLFLTALLLDYLRSEEDWGLNFSLKALFSRQNLLWWLLLIFIFLILGTINYQGAHFAGDPYFHLSIMRKAIEGKALTISNLGFVKGASIHLAYGVPIWHIFLAAFTKIIGSNIFTVWYELPMALSAIAFLVNYWFFRRILPTRDLAIIALFLYIIFYYRLVDAGYIFLRLPVPDTLCQLILLPLMMAFTLKYVFDKAANYKLLLILSILSLFLAAIHVTHYFYFLVAMVIFILTYSILGLGSPDYKSVLKKILLATFANIVMFLPLLLILESKGKAISTIFKAFWAVQFTPHSYIDIFPFLAIPFVMLFYKKHQGLIFLIATLLVMPIAFSKFLQVWLSKILGADFLLRFYQNITLDHVVWALAIGFILYVIDLGLSKISAISKYLRYLFELIFLLGGIWIVWLENKSGAISILEKKLLTVNLNFLYLHRTTLVIITMVLALAIIIVEKKWPKLLSFFKVADYKNPVAIYLMLFVILFFLFSLSFGNLKKFDQLAYEKKTFFLVSPDITPMIINPASFGGQEAIDFIQTKIPSKSVFLVSFSISYSLPMLADQYIAAYLLSPADLQFNQIFTQNLPVKEQLELLVSSQTEYIVLDPLVISIQDRFDSLPNYYTKIYANQAIIYQVNTANVSNDFNNL